MSELATSSYWDNEIEKQHQWNTKQPPCLKANVILRKKQTHVELARYLHAACFSPVTSTFVKAIRKGHFKTWPRLTSHLVEKHLPPSVATTKGHMVQEKQHLQSTKQTSLRPIDVLCDKTSKLSLKTVKFININDVESDFFPQSLVPNIKENCAAYLVVNLIEMSTAYMDLTGRFPRRSSQGN